MNGQDTRYVFVIQLMIQGEMIKEKIKMVSDKHSIALKNFAFKLI